MRIEKVNDLICDDIRTIFEEHNAEKITCDDISIWFEGGTLKVENRYAKYECSGKDGSSFRYKVSYKESPNHFEYVKIPGGFNFYINSVKSATKKEGSRMVEIAEDGTETACHICSYSEPEEYYYGSIRHYDEHDDGGAICSFGTYDHRCDVVGTMYGTTIVIYLTWWVRLYVDYADNTMRVTRFVKGQGI